MNISKNLASLTLIQLSFSNILHVCVFMSTSSSVKYDMRIIHSVCRHLPSCRFSLFVQNIFYQFKPFPPIIMLKCQTIAILFYIFSSIACDNRTSENLDEAFNSRVKKVLRFYECNKYLIVENNFP